MVSRGAVRSRGLSVVIAGGYFPGRKEFFFFSCVGTKTKMLFHRRKYCSATLEVTQWETESTFIVLLST